MKKMFVTAILIVASGFMGALYAQAAETITGAGATFPYPVYAKWAYLYNKETGVKLNYQSIGSGGGIKQIKSNTVDFGASDAPLEPDELEKSGLLQFPMIMGGVVPVLNVPGIGANQLTLSGDVLADIYLGKINKWNDDRIKKLNPELNLPADGIAVVHRADGSGTTWIFTNYLSKVSDEWGKKVGNDKAVSWPLGMGGKGNEGVANFVRTVPNSIGYVEYAYALQSKMTSVKLVNHDGDAVAPTAENFQAAASGADWANAKGFYVVLTDQPGANSWPITGTSFILIHKKHKKPQKALEVLKFFDWSYKKGGEAAMSLDYVPMPEEVVEMVEKSWASDIRGSDDQPIWK